MVSVPLVGSAGGVRGVVQIVTTRNGCACGHMEYRTDHVSHLTLETHGKPEAC